MEVSRTESLPPPPGIINSIKAGFDAVAAHITAIIFPLALNLFLWLGPRLQLDGLVNSLKPDLIAGWQRLNVPQENIEKMVEQLATLPNVNLFALLRTFPIGISSLPFSEGIKTPLGLPVVLQVSELSLFGWIFLLIFIGWIFGGFYFRAVAQLTINPEAQALSLARAIAQTLLAAVSWSALVFIISTPLFIVLAILAQISQALASLAILLLSILSMWVIVPLFFWAHGVFVKRQNILVSILSSIQMTRFTLPTTAMFVLTIFLLSFGLNYLWTIPPKDSWMTLVGIFGHSFVSAALLASSFIYFRDMNDWLQMALEKFKSGKKVISNQ